MARRAARARAARDRDQRRERGDHQDRLRRGVGRARDARCEIDGDRRRERRGHRGLAAAPPAHEPDAEREGAEQRSEVEERRRDRAVPGLEAEVPAGPDPERLERRHLVDEVSELVVELDRLGLGGPAEDESFCAFSFLPLPPLCFLGSACPSGTPPHRPPAPRPSRRPPPSLGTRPCGRSRARPR